MQDPDLETARFQILDFSCDGPKAPRTLTVIDARQIPRSKEKRKTEMLEVFAEGYFLAVAILADRGVADPHSDRPDDEAPGPDPRQPDLFE